VPKLLTCPQGHRWDPTASGLAVRNPTCPVCGAAPAAGSAAEVGTLPPRSAASQDTLQSPAPATPAGGSLPEVFGRYRIEKELGRGGMGAVYLAHDTQLQRRVALKVPHFIPEDGPQILQRFHREAKTAATLQHANLCSVYDYGEINGTPYLAMAFVEGQPLSDLLRRLGKPLTMRQAAALVRTLALALEEAHRRKVVHRDLKPDNVMITVRGEPIIMDFGLARRDSQTVVRLTKQGTIMGTPAYMAPEQARGDPDQMGPACDIYSLGVILYEVLTRKQPFVGDALSIVTQVLMETPKPPSAHRPDVDPRLEAVCLRAMAKQPEARYGSMAEFAAALAEYLDATAGTGSTELPVAEPPAAAAAPPAPARRGWGWAALGGAIVAVVLGGVGYVLMKQKVPPTESGAAVPSPPADLPKPPPISPSGDANTAPQPSARPGAPDLSAAKQLFASNFAAGKGWPTGKPEGFEAGFRDGHYYLRCTAPGLHGVHVPYTEPLENFACEVVGRFQGRAGGAGAHRWGVGLSNASQADKATRAALRVRVARNGDVSVVLAPADKVLTGPVKPQSIKGSDAFNTLLIVVRERTLKVYVNGTVVGEPVAVPGDLMPARLGIFVQGTKVTEAEFEKLTVWSAADLPPARRGATK
jgi:predicted Ser/Thr protein kinase